MGRRSRVQGAVLPLSLCDVLLKIYRSLPRCAACWTPSKRMCPLTDKLIVTVPLHVLPYIYVLLFFCVKGSLTKKGGYNGPSLQASSSSSTVAPAEDPL